MRLSPIRPWAVGLLLAAVSAGGDRQTLHERIRQHSQEAAAYIKRGADAVVKPIIGLNGILASINAFFERMKL